jgi:hypothetical protein
MDNPTFHLCIYLAVHRYTAPVALYFVEAAILWVDLPLLPRYVVHVAKSVDI